MSKRPGSNGSECINAFPPADADVQPDTLPASRERAQKSLSILIIDDNVASADAIGWLVELLDHKSYILYEGSELITSALEIMPDVIMLDLGLPGKNGYDLCRELRSYPQFASTLLIAQTGSGQEKDKRRAIEAGFDHHLVKPFQMPELQALLERATQN